MLWVEDTDAVYGFYYSNCECIRFLWNVFDHHICFFFFFPSKCMMAVVQPSAAQPLVGLWAGCESFGTELCWKRRQGSFCKRDSYSPPDLHQQFGSRQRTGGVIGNAASVAVIDAAITWYPPRFFKDTVIRKRALKDLTWFYSSGINCARKGGTLMRVSVAKQAALKTASWSTSLIWSRSWCWFLRGWLGFHCLFWSCRAWTETFELGYTFFPSAFLANAFKPLWKQILETRTFDVSEEKSLC